MAEIIFNSAYIVPGSANFYWKFSWWEQLLLQELGGMIDAVYVVLAYGMIDLDVFVLIVEFDTLAS